MIFIFFQKYIHCSLHYGEQKRATTGMAHFWTIVVGCTMSFDWASDRLSLVSVRLILKNFKIVIREDRTHTGRVSIQTLTTMPTMLCSNKNDKINIFLPKLIFDVLISDRRFFILLKNNR